MFSASFAIGQLLVGFLSGCVVGLIPGIIAWRRFAHEKQQWISRIVPPTPDEIERYGLPRKDKWDKGKIIAEAATPVVALVWAILSWALLQSYQRSADRRQADAATQALVSQRKISSAQVAAGLAPSLAKGSLTERQIALVILAEADPDFAQKISPGVLEQAAKTPTEREQGAKVAREIVELSAKAKVDQDFLHHLENARVYRTYQLNGSADREYSGASDCIPPQFNVDAEKIRQAKKAFANGNVDEAASIFEQAFHTISTP